MYLTPETMHQVLTQFGQHAPPKSILLFDAMFWLAINQHKRHPLLRDSDAHFRWGIRCLSELTSDSVRLQLKQVFHVTDGYHWKYKLMRRVTRSVLGVPFYTIYQLSVS